MMHDSHRALKQLALDAHGEQLLQKKMFLSMQQSTVGSNTCLSLNTNKPLTP